MIKLRENLLSCKSGWTVYSLIFYSIIIIIMNSLVLLILYYNYDSNKVLVLILKYI